jgi:hypothetical protein
MAMFAQPYLPFYCSLQQCYKTFFFSTDVEAK